MRVVVWKCRATSFETAKRKDCWDQRGLFKWITVHWCRMETWRPGEIENGCFYCFDSSFPWDRVGRNFFFLRKKFYAVSVQFSRSLSHPAIPWTAAPQASLSITNSRSLPKLVSIESVMSPNYLILCRSFLLLPSVFPSIRVFKN